MGSTYQLLTLAQGVAGGIEWEKLLNYGVLGLFVVLMMSGYMYPKPMVDHLREENKRLRDDNQTMRDENTKLRIGVEEKVVPALVRVTDLLQKASEKGVG